MVPLMPEPNMLSESLPGCLALDLGGLPCTFVGSMLVRGTWLVNWPCHPVVVCRAFPCELTSEQKHGETPETTAFLRSLEKPRRMELVQVNSSTNKSSWPFSPWPPERHVGTIGDATGTIHKPNAPLPLPPFGHPFEGWCWV